MQNLDTGLVEIDLSINGCNIGNELVKYGYAAYKQIPLDSTIFEHPPNPDIKPGTIEDVYVPVLNDPFDMHVQPLSAFERFEPVEVQMQDYYNKPENSSSLKLNSAPVGLFCVSIYKEDNQWYRAIVKGQS